MYAYQKCEKMFQVGKPSSFVSVELENLSCFSLIGSGRYLVRGRGT